METWVMLIEYHSVKRFFLLNSSACSARVRADKIGAKSAPKTRSMESGLTILRPPTHPDGLAKFLWLLAFDSLILNFSSKFKFFRFADIFIHVRPGVSHVTANSQGSKPAAHPLVLSRQRRHFGAPRGSFRRCLYQLVKTIYLTVTE